MEDSTVSRRCTFREAKLSFFGVTVPRYRRRPTAVTTAAIAAFTSASVVSQPSEKRIICRAATLCGFIAQVVERGELDRLWRMLYDLESGQPG